MEKEGISIVLVFALICFSKISALETEDKSTDLCSITAAKRMLSDLGINTSHGSCLLQKKRDVANLVTSYLEYKMGAETIAKKSLLDEFEDMLRDEITKKISKRGKYCCSPHCDKFMSRMGNPHAALIKCN